MSRIYSVVYKGTITAAGTDTDLFSFLPATNKPIKLRGFRLSQISEVGDTQEEGLEITVKRFPAACTVGSGGSAPTPSPMDSADTAAGFTARANDTTVMSTSGTAVVLDDVGWNERNSPCDFWYPDVAFCPKAKNGEGLAITMQTTLADDMTGVFTAWIEEE